MRSELDVLTLLLDFAREEEAVRVVSMNGSRVNSQAPADCYRDFDIVFAVSYAEKFVSDQSWINRFGELVIKQQLENPMQSGNQVTQTFLLQFFDGVRIDLSFKPLEYLDEIVNEDTLTKVLLDKDNRCGQLSPPDDRGWHVKKPTEKQFDAVLNELWWLQAYVAKGLLRDELPYAKHALMLIQDNIEQLLSWYIGIRYNWCINVGANCKWLKRFLPEDVYAEYLGIYAGADCEQYWQALSNSQKLIRRIGREVAEQLGCQYPLQDDINVTRYLSSIHESEQSVSSKRYYDSLPKKLIAAKILLFNQSGELLIVKPSYKPYWGLPGGIVEADESPVDACAREVYEEIGLNIVPELADVEWLPSTVEYPERIHFTFRAACLTTIEIESIKIDGQEIVDFRFVMPEQAYELLNHNIVAGVRRCIAKSLTC
ncbi:MAG: aminoglycoside 6-adenylyltransferase [Bacillota bacterium]